MAKFKVGFIASKIPQPVMRDKGAASWEGPTWALTPGQGLPPDQSTTLKPGQLIRKTSPPTYYAYTKAGFHPLRRKQWKRNVTEAPYVPQAVSQSPLEDPTG